MNSEQIKNKVYLAQQYLEKAEKLISQAFDNDAFALDCATKIGDILDATDDYLMEVCLQIEAEEFSED